MAAGALVSLLGEVRTQRLDWCLRQSHCPSLKTISVVCSWIGVWKSSNLGFHGDTLGRLSVERLDGMRHDGQYYLRTLPHRLGTARQVDSQAAPSGVSYFSRKASTMFKGGFYSVTSAGISSGLTSFL